MPSKTTDISAATAARLGAIGACIRRRRKLLRISAVNAAEAAGMSRITLHRIERGEPSVTMGAYLGAMAALGLDLAVGQPGGQPATAEGGEAGLEPLPERIRLDGYPQLKRLAWQLRGTLELTPREALDLYERNWRHVDAEAMDAGERALVQRLAATVGGGACLFERAHHRRIQAVLEALDAPLLAGHHCYFGGGTAIALRHGEYRESVDIDFMVSDLAGYRALRQLLTGPSGVNAIARAPAALQQAREIRADQYGIRTLLEVDTSRIKFEIVLEARIQFDTPAEADRICGVAALTPLDMAASKLLANSDRWADDAVFSRDLIDLAMMQPRGKLLQAALAKARVAYGQGIDADLARAIERLAAREGRLERCMDAMQMTTVPRALLWQRIKSLAPRRAAGPGAAQ